ncbi:hypothetical protein EU546_06890 [Candidatus Thorarchaeota archaeon]|nr:MAG: hypothetical protein EU546_06890 [Candidatus Thorarchaeota archaeon]
MRIEDYEFGRIVIDGKVYTDDVILIGDTVHPDWWRKRGHELQPVDLKEVFNASVDLLIVGTGYYGRMSVPDSTREAIEEEGLNLIVEKTGDATQIYNEQQSKDGVAAALHLSC